MMPVFAVQLKRTLVELNTVDKTPLGDEHDPLALSIAAVETKFSFDDESILETLEVEVEVGLILPFELPVIEFDCPKEVVTRKRTNA